MELERAKAMIETAVSKRPQDGFITDSLGWVLFRLGDYEGAVVHLERAVTLEPGDPVINDHLGDAYWLVGRKLEARYQWLRALSLEPDAEVEADIRLKLDGQKVPEPLPRQKPRYLILGPGMMDADDRPEIVEQAPAKINLYLHVNHRRDDGYHDLESLVVFTEFGDWVRLSPRRR